MNRRTRGWAVAAAAAVTAALVAVGLTAGSPAAGEPVPDVTASAAVDLARSDPGDPMALGDPEAPVLMIEWADLRCYYCGVFSEETLPALISEYVDQGLVRIEWHPAVVLGDTSTDAAIAARAAAEQGLFWEFVDALYATMPTRETVWSSEALIELGGSIDGLDLNLFADGLVDPELRAAVQADVERAEQAGVTGTPTFLIGDELVVGAQPLAEFQRVIQEQLDRS